MRNQGAGCGKSAEQGRLFQLKLSWTAFVGRSVGKAAGGQRHCGLGTGSHGAVGACPGYDGCWAAVACGLLIARDADLSRDRPQRTRTMFARPGSGAHALCLERSNQAGAGEPRALQATGCDVPARATAFGPGCM